MCVCVCVVVRVGVGVCVYIYNIYGAAPQCTPKHRCWKRWSCCFFLKKHICLYIYIYMYIYVYIYKQVGSSTGNSEAKLLANIELLFETVDKNGDFFFSLLALLVQKYKY